MFLKNKTEAQWNCFNKRYALDHEKKDPLNFWEFSEILSLCEPKSHSRVLEIGCNTGEFCHLLNSTADCYVKGIDINREAISIAHQKYAEIDFQAVDVMNLKESASYDAVYMQHVIEHLENPKEALLAIRNLLKGNGLLILSCPNKWAYLSKFTARLFFTQFCYDPTHLHWFSPASIRQLLTIAGFHIVKIKTKPMGIPAKGIPDFLQSIYYDLPAASFGAYIFVLACKTISQ